MRSSSAAGKDGCALQSLETRLVLGHSGVWGKDAQVGRGGALGVIGIEPIAGVLNAARTRRRERSNYCWKVCARPDSIRGCCWGFQERTRVKWLSRVRSG